MRTPETENAMMLSGGSHFVGPIFYSEEVQKYGDHLVRRIGEELNRVGMAQLPHSDGTDLSWGEVMVDEQSVAWKIVEFEDSRARRKKLKSLLVMFTRELVEKYSDE